MSAEPDEPSEDGAEQGSGEPFAVESEVVCENGEWAVYLEFLTPHGPLRRFIATYPSEASARMASRWLVWTARRDVRPPDGLFRFDPSDGRENELDRG